MNQRPIRIGTSGYVYEHWKGPFYPENLPEEEWFAHYAKGFDTVEMNNTFYNLPGEKTFRDWRERAPEGFVYALKASRYLTHMKKLTNPEEPWRTFRDRAELLQDRLGPVLVQLPPNWHCNADRLAAFLDLLGKDNVAPVFEFRDPSWYTEEVYALLDEAGAVLCVHDWKDAPSPRRAAGDFVYCRFHGSTGVYEGRYGEEALAPWADWIGEQVREEDRQVYAYFNNDQHGYAVEDARTLRALLEERT